MKRILPFFIFVLSNLGIAQDGYYGKPSSYVPNGFEPNIVFNFDYKMTGTLSFGSHSFPFTIYVNTADGSWAVTDDVVADMIGRSTVSDDEKFDFLVYVPFEVTRGYYTVYDPDEGEKKVFYSLNRALSAPAAQLEFAQEENFADFMQNANITNAGNHSAFGPQKLYSGNFNGKEVNVTISNRSAPIKITPLHVGFLCGVFQDGTQYKNRYITKFETPEITVEMHSFSPEQLILDGSDYLEQEGYATMNVESIVDNESTFEDIAERMDRLSMENRDAVARGDTDKISLIALKMSIEGQRLRAITTGHPERQISEGDAAQLVGLKDRIQRKTKECKRYKGTEYEAECKRQLNRLQSRFEELRSRYLVSPR
ncbi:MAG: hypothetical protein CMH48_03970 [Muricauda sp.]|nr:hypothetical protein [Allomuricauda sp.]MAU17651.1 hypothetical protein [Allomuricauda sp.]MBC29982.1 hypothetical protein [Allomuricauda sp.]|tara:strand:+ start:105380 stop:106486 length:1107 start_codon:yes stop_codon:yes gene_type:complete